MKTLIEKIRHTQETVVAVCVIASLALFFAIVIYNSISQGIGL